MPTPLSSARTESTIEIRTLLDRRIGFALQQNDVPVIKSVRIENKSDAPIKDLRLTVSSDPDFAQPLELRIAQVDPGATFDCGALDLVLLPRFLGGVTERVRGFLRFRVLQAEQLLHERVEPVVVLARDEWGGLASLPEILSAFVLPNHPAIERILRSAADILGTWTGDPSLSGYQSKDPNRTALMAAAVYSAIRGLGITYVNPPASFEVEGQRVRLPDRIVETSLATCFDLALLTAGCLEQVGLNPLVVMVKEHAFVGVWLHEECFGEPAVEDPLRLRKRVDLGEIVVFDPTCCTSRPSPEFNGAVQEARRRLEEPESFLCAIDVARSRKGQIRPLPERVGRDEPSLDDRPIATEGPVIPLQPDTSFVEHRASTDPALPAPETPATRLDRWRRKLLDLTLRNRLLNFRETKKTIPILCPDLPALEDALADGATFRVLPRLKDLTEGDPRSQEVHLRRTGKDALANILREELQASRLHADLTPEELDRRLLETYRAARLGLEEGGASALYLALGFCAWYETPQSTQRRLAPILLLPLELHRKSALEGFSVRLSDDEPRLNVTLLEMLKQDHGITIEGLDPLPRDESGYDVPRIFRTIRETIRDVDRWDLLEIARIGIFSFAKFLMWRDLVERADDLLLNRVVKHLVHHAEQEFDPGAAFPNEDRLDEEKKPAETFCPLPADGSQLAAVFAAAEGRSFVLEGPPGTGKSQTITNIIAHCLATGKTVLFVSQKMAALNVVHDRLHKVGLGRFCLELHSNKANKREVLAQLSEALQAGDTSTPEEWEHTATHLEKLRTELNAYVSALHQRRASGESVFQVTSRLIGLRDAPHIALGWPADTNVDAERLGALRESVERLRTVAGAIGSASAHPWRAVRHAAWTPAWAEDVRAALERLRKSIAPVAAAAAPLSTEAALEPGSWSQDELSVLRDLAELLSSSPAPPRRLVVETDWPMVEEKIGGWIAHGRRRDALRTEVLADFTPQILDLDLDALQNRLTRANASRWPVSWWHGRAVKAQLRAVSTIGKAPQNAEVGSILSKARELRDEERALTAAGEDARSLLGRFWKAGESQWAEVETVREWTGRLRALALRAAKRDSNRAAELREVWASLAAEEVQTAGAGTARDTLSAFISAYDAFVEARRAVEALLELDVAAAWGKATVPEILSVIEGTCARGLESAGSLRDWCAWRLARLEAVNQGLAPLVEAYEAGDFLPEMFVRAFDRSYSQWWHSHIVSGEATLAQFFSPEHERKIHRFRDVDDRYTDLTRQVIAARLSTRRPSSGTVDLPNSEVGILKRQIAKKRGNMPIRQLLQTVRNLLPRLKPCLLMSPMSVAQYFDADHPPFDVVIFDEASQMPVWDAIGAIARGSQAVIVGDPKQLPPTSFFTRADGDEDDDSQIEVIEDLESILDDCMSARLPWLPLNWHYRSRHESLIAFSNFHYYNNRLLTFPSPHRLGMGVSWRHVPEGVYDRGKSSTNLAEAECVVEDVLRRLRAAGRDAGSIGVVTFSEAQQRLIEDLLEQARRNDPAVDAFFAEDAPEPVFVKNLENVQGDERDVILFSICYGPDELGRVYMNFGPMNRDGGERRLNVAVTRARREVVVFSTLRADQIDLSRSRARGVQDLKNFLEYAERGPSALAAESASNVGADFESYFERSVSQALEKMGWEVHRQVGCARYRIDLAVVDPHSPGRYLLGVECDGATYHRAKTARDRDKLREGVLRGLGWRLHRVWSTDWWSNPDAEIAKLDVALKGAAKSSGPGQRTEVEPTRYSSVAAQPAPAIASRTAPPRALGQMPPLEATPPSYRPFQVEVNFGSQQDFYLPNASARIRTLIVEVVRREWPVSLGLVARRVAAHWGLNRVHQKALDRVESLIPKNAVTPRTSMGMLFLWPADANPRDYGLFRVPDHRPESERDADDLPVEEVANAAHFVLKQHVGAPEAELVREVSRLFGFQRTGSVIDARVRAGVTLLVERGIARRTGESVTLAKS